MAWRFHAIDATLSPWPCRLDGVEAHEGPRNISQDNLTHWLISTQVAAGVALGDLALLVLVDGAAAPFPRADQPRVAAGARERVFVGRGRCGQDDDGQAVF